MELPSVYLLLDPYLIWAYRLPGAAWVGFLVGTLVLATLALIIGEFTISLAFLAARKVIQKTADTAVKYQNLSIEALQAGDKKAYSATNKLANEAFGKSFFLQIALSTARLWPIFLALAWMQTRFADIEFPLPRVGLSLGYLSIFLLMYIAAYFLFKRLKPRLPYFRWIKTLLDASQTQVRDMKNLSDPLPAARQPDNHAKENTAHV